ncbi:hemerythrin domain-containing protein [Thiohalomonas denitrificans]|uniref:hemerythrin domain-containing protein n=1 Tax=Thiohalomonas denitrificans TaxID=415747 RepID=UPI0026F37687|nr:hemerythrin domain-containing protein [Thiohalomonas denitrificans]
MDAIEFLKVDHAHVRDLVGRMMATNVEQLDLRHQLFELLRQEFEIHTQIEEHLLYPVIERQGSHEQEQVRDSVEEHQELRDRLAQLAKIDLSDSSWKQSLIEFNEVLEHHLSDEEEDLFPRARREIGSELEQMGGRMYQEKGERLREYSLR